MIGGSTVGPAVARSAKAQAGISALATLRTTDPPWGPLFRNAYAITNGGKPACQKMESHAVLWGAAPKSPVGEKNTGKIIAWAMGVNAGKKDPPPRTKDAPGG